MMSAEPIFSIANMVAVVGWLLLLVVPRSSGARFVAGTVIPLGLSALYLVLLALHLSEGRGSFSVWFAFLLDVRCRAWRNSSRTSGCCSLAGCTTSRSICSSARGKPSTRCREAYPAGCSRRVWR